LIALETPIGKNRVNFVDIPHMGDARWYLRPVDSSTTVGYELYNAKDKFVGQWHDRTDQALLFERPALMTGMLIGLQHQHEMSEYWGEVILTKDQRASLSAQDWPSKAKDKKWLSAWLHLTYSSLIIR